MTQFIYNIRCISQSNSLIISQIKKRINNQEVIYIEWYVYYHDFNAQKIIKYNIFDHGTFTKEINEIKKKTYTKEEFAEKLDSMMRYYFWSKCEYEVIISPWAGQADNMKIDIYDQIHLNWNVFMDYCWSCKLDFH